MILGSNIDKIMELKNKIGKRCFEQVEHKMVNVLQDACDSHLDFYFQMIHCLNRADVFTEEEFEEQYEIKDGKCEAKCFIGTEFESWGLNYVRVCSYKEENNRCFTIPYVVIF